MSSPIEYYNTMNLILEEYKKKNYLREQELKKKNIENQKIIEEGYISNRKVLDEHQADKNSAYKLKKSLLFECIMDLYNKSLNEGFSDNVTERIKASVVNNFINEQGTETLLRKFKTKNYLLSEYYRIINKYFNVMTESKKCKDNNECDEIKVDTSSKDKFYDDLKTDSIDDAARLIRNRVSHSIDEFISQNAKEQVELKDIIQKTQDASSNVKSEAAKIDLENDAKRSIIKIRDGRRRNMLECIVNLLSESSYKDDTLGKMYLSEGKLNLNAIVENAETIYTFLEMVNTTQMINVNESYLSNILKGLKK